MCFQELQDMCKDQVHFPVFAVSREGENITIDKGVDDGGDFFLVTSLRRDGWHVMHKYHASN